MERTHCRMVAAVIYSLQTFVLEHDFTRQPKSKDTLRKSTKLQRQSHFITFRHSPAHQNPGKRSNHPSIASLTTVSLEHLFASAILCFFSTGQSTPQ